MTRLASTAPFPYTSQRVAFLTASDGVIEQLSLNEAIERAREGAKIYGAWPGEWRQDVFLCDDIVAWADSPAGRNRSGQPTLKVRCRRCKEVVPLTRAGQLYMNHHCVLRARERSSDPANRDGRDWWTALTDWEEIDE